MFNKMTQITKYLYGGNCISPKTLPPFIMKNLRTRMINLYQSETRPGTLPLVSFLIYYAASSDMSDSYMATKYKIMPVIKSEAKQLLPCKSHLIYVQKLEFFTLSKYLLKHFSTLLVFHMCSYLFVV